MAGRLLTTAQLAERTGYAEQTLRRWRCEWPRKKEGPRWIGRGRGVRYPEDWVEEWVTTQDQTADR
jgi:predicted DNA-binding transcriptional regulator AlpA